MSSRSCVPALMVIVVSLMVGTTAQGADDLAQEIDCDIHHDKRCAAAMTADGQALAGGTVPAYVFVDGGETGGEPAVDASVDASVHANASAGGHSVNESADASANLDGDPFVEDDAVLVPCSDPRGCPDLGIDRVDLVKDLRVRNERISEGDCNIEEGSTEAGLRRMIRFTLTTPNRGAGDLFVGDPDDRPDLFVWATCHQHHHFLDFADYRLWSDEGYRQWRDLREQRPGDRSGDVLADNPGLQQHLVSGHKQGFCMIDVKPHDVTVPSRFTHCDNQGITAGWGDVYVASLDGQFIDITGVESGWYVLEVEVNAERLLEESDYTDNIAAIQMFIPPE